MSKTIEAFLGNCYWVRQHLRVVRAIVECDPALHERIRDRLLEELDAAAEELGIDIKQNNAGNGEGEGACNISALRSGTDSSITRTETRPG